MMSEIVQFFPRHDIDAAANLAAFIRLCRDDLKVFGPVDWDANEWDVSDEVGSQSGHSERRTSLCFSSASGVPFRNPFADFVKAYLRYAYGWRPTKSHMRRLFAARMLEEALTETIGSGDVSKAGPEIFNRAAAKIKVAYAPGTAYAVGGALSKIAEFLSEHRLVGIPFQWTSPIRAHHSSLKRIGAEADAVRQKKLPSQSALDALPKCFSLAQSPRDIVISSISALLCSAPDRIGEVFSLPADCEVEAVHDGNMRYGLRWWPEKGAEPMVKWIPPIMVDVVKEAIRRLRLVTDHAREIAAWYVKHPAQIYLPEKLCHLRGAARLNNNEAADILGFAKGNSAWVWGRNHDVTIHGRDTQRFVYFSDLERAVLTTLPSSFPIADRRTGLRFDEALLIMRLSEMTDRFGTSSCMIEAIKYDHVRFGLSLSKRGSTIFSRLGFTEPDGSPIRMSTHQFRHWLNTIAQRGGLSQLDIAKWSGRANIHQNSVYDHMTADEFMVMARDVAEDDRRLFGPLAEISARIPVSHAEFIRAQFPMAHTTELGFCVHDFAMLPCQLHRDCINCEEHVCVKGDKAKTEHIRKQLTIAEEQLARAGVAVGGGTWGADRWLEHHLATVARLRFLLGILDDPEVPNGSIIRMAPPGSLSTPDDRLRFADIPEMSTHPSFLDETRLLLDDMS